MIAVPSGNFLKEFTLLAERIAEEGEMVIVQRPNGKNVVMMSLDAFNDMQKALYQAKKAAQAQPSSNNRNKRPKCQGGTR